MMTTLLLSLAAISADPTENQIKLLKTFREEFIHVTPGEGKYPKSFTMGRGEGGHDSERPAHRVAFGYGFHIAKYEVPQNLWEAVMGSNPSRWKGPRNSVEMLSFDEAAEFCRKATELMRAAKLIGGDQVIRLPSEAEWEYVARAGTTTVYSFGDDAADLDEYGWHTGNAAGNDPPVGAKKPNAWGLYDVHGYLWEWCADAAHDNYDGAPTDGSAWIKGGDDKRRVIRGGSWKDKADLLTSSCRSGVYRTRDKPIEFTGGIDKELRDDALGLRCVLAAAPNEEEKRESAAAADEFRPTAQDEFVPKDAKLELLWNDGDFTEGPALAPDGTILFTDIGTRIMRFDPATKKVTVFRENSGKANGLMFNRKGQLLACEGAGGGNRRVSITNDDGTVESLADNWQGKKFNSPNDLAIARGGVVYFTDPRYGGNEPREIDFEGVFAIHAPGDARLATRDVEKPNGILVSLDGHRAYVADNNPRGVRHFLVFDIAKDGSLAKKRVLFDFGKGRGIDGMTLDTDGNIYATAGSGEKAGIYVFGPEGEQLAFIPTPGDPTNCVFGGGSERESKTLYITANGPKPEESGKPRRYALYRIRLAKTGHHLVPLR